MQKNLKLELFLTYSSVTYKKYELEPVRKVQGKINVL